MLTQTASFALTGKLWSDIVEAEDRTEEGKRGKKEKKDCYGRNAERSQARRRDLREKKANEEEAAKENEEYRTNRFRERERWKRARNRDRERGCSKGCLSFVSPPYL